MSMKSIEELNAEIFTDPYGIEESRFFGKCKMSSKKYFKFNHIISDDEFIIITNNLKVIKGQPVLVVDNNKGVYLKEWNISEVRNWYTGLQAYAIKLNRKYFKPYTFRFNFEDMCFDEEDTFDSLKEIAAEQNHTEIAVGHGKCKWE